MACQSSLEYELKVVFKQQIYADQADAKNNLVLQVL